MGDLRLAAVWWNKSAISIDERGQKKGDRFSAKGQIHECDDKGTIFRKSMPCSIHLILESGLYYRTG